MQHTPEQLEAYARIKRDYGKPWPKMRAPNAKTGNACIELTCAAGTWYWWLDESGKLIDRALVGRLFTPEIPQRRPGNALDN